MEKETHINLQGSIPVQVDRRFVADDENKFDRCIHQRSRNII